MVLHGYLQNTINRKLELALAHIPEVDQQSKKLELSFSFRCETKCYYCFEFGYNGKEATVNIARDGSMYPVKS
jgi:hypothetical protein